MVKVVETNAEMYKFMVIGNTIFLGENAYPVKISEESPPQLKKAT